MNREIKFRAWDKDIKKFYYDCSFLMVCHDKIFYKAHLDNWSVSDTRCEFQQYTGLKDKNGKEIYEGDIVKALNNDLYTIQFGAYTTVYHDDEEGSHVGFFAKRKSGHIESIDRSGDWAEIVGNIYENANLLTA